jgi:spore germination cell wall hydrolase CwlJ-like protein
MSVFRTLTVGACLLSATGFAAANAQIFAAEAVAPATPAEAPLPASPAAAPEAPEPAPAAAAIAPVPASTPAPAAAPKAPARVASATTAAPDRELTCLAKIVVHEAGNQSRAGQLAVAQVVMNRVRSPRFPNTICGVAMQPGQFFNVHAYNPPRDARWRRALDVARDARDGVSAPVVGNALFFRAAYASSAFFNSRTRVATLGDHVFYR